MPAPSETTPSAERQREYRARDKSGSLWASAFVPRDLAEKLITGGLLPESESSDKKSLGVALVEAARHWSNSVIPSRATVRTAAIFRPWHLESTGSAERPMTCSQAELRSKNTALTRRRLPLLAAQARSELPDQIRRPASAPVGRGQPS